MNNSSSPSNVGRRQSPDPRATMAANTSSSSTIELVERGAILSPNASPVASKMRRRFYHLGVERFDLPPRDADVLSDPACVAYIPSAAPGMGSNAMEMQRVLQYNANGAPPPKPKYFSDVDRCKHFVHGRGGTDVAPHFINRPSFQLCTGDAPLSMHTPLLKEMLTANVQELQHLRGQLEDTVNRSRRDHASAPSSTILSDLMISSSSPQPYRSTEYSGMTNDSDPSASAVSPLPRVATPNVSSPSFTVSQARSSSSLEIARKGSSLEATRSVRRYHQLLKREQQLKALTRMGHPNLVTVYLPQ